MREISSEALARCGGIKSKGWIRKHMGEALTGECRAAYKAAQHMPGDASARGPCVPEASGACPRPTCYGRFAAVAPHQARRTTAHPLKKMARRGRAMGIGRSSVCLEMTGLNRAIERRREVHRMSQPGSQRTPGRLESFRTTCRYQPGTGTPGCGRQRAAV